MNAKEIFAYAKNFRKKLSVMETRSSSYGWKPDLPDHRDYMYAPKPTGKEKKVLLPAFVDLTPKFPYVYNQGSLGSCTANAIAGALQFLQHEDYSRLFIYYNERVIEGTTATDSGAAIRDGIKTITKDGVCPESMWPYLVDKFATRPCPQSYTAAKKDVISSYLRINTFNDMRACLAEGFPFVFGFSMYEGFESSWVAKTGDLSVPLSSNEKLLGGHAVLCVGYDDVRQHVIVRNSWGSNWGLNGYFTMPYAYINNPDLVADFWTIRK